jgi:hypothetical protein
VGEVIDVAFGIERDWQATRAKIEQRLLEIGGMYGDGPEIMRVKAEAIFRMLRHMVNGVPPISIQAVLPEDLDPEQMAMVAKAVEQAALKGVETTLTHCVGCFMEDMYDVATSKLSGVRK